MTTTRTEAADLLRLLQAARSPQTAADLARRLGLSGLRETQRRHLTRRSAKCLLFIVWTFQAYLNLFLKKNVMFESMNLNK